MSSGRDDSALYSGITSASFASKTETEIKKRRAESKDEQRLKKPGDAILEIIAKHKDKITHIMEFAVEDMQTEEHFNAEVMARKKFYKFLTTFEAQVRVALKEGK